VPSVDYLFVTIRSRPLRDIRSEISLWPYYETGGPLIGYAYRDRAVVTHAFGPGKKAIRTKWSVKIDGEYATEVAYKLQKESDGQLYYLGDWHVHHGGPLVPSLEDKKAARLLLRAKACPTGCYLDVIFSDLGLKAQAFSYSAALTQKQIHVILATDEFSPSDS